jgi:hypothetical protein
MNESARDESIELVVPLHTIGPHDGLRDEFIVIESHDGDDGGSDDQRDGYRGLGL